MDTRFSVRAPRRDDDGKLLCPPLQVEWPDDALCAFLKLGTERQRETMSKVRECRQNLVDYVRNMVDKGQFKQGMRLGDDESFFYEISELLKLYKQVAHAALYEKYLGEGKNEKIASQLAADSAHSTVEAYTPAIDHALAEAASKAMQTIDLTNRFSTAVNVQDLYTHSGKNLFSGMRRCGM